MSPAPLVSVLTTVYNGKRFLPRRVDSILHQTLTDWEWIVVDDASTDGSADFLQSKLAGEGRVKVVRLDQNQGIVAAGAVAFGLATGKYIYRTDQDDACDDSFLETMVCLMESEPNVGLASCRGLQMDDEDGVWGGLPRSKSSIEPGFEAFRRLVVRYDLKSPTVLLRRSSVLAAGGWVTLKGLRSSADWHLALRLCLVSDVARVAEPLAYFREHGENSSATQWLEPELGTLEADTFGVVEDALRLYEASAGEDVESLRIQAIAACSATVLAIAKRAKARGHEGTAAALRGLVARRSDGARPGSRKSWRARQLKRIVRSATYRRLPPVREEFA